MKTLETGSRIVKSNNLLWFGRRGIILAAVAVSVGLVLPAYCQVSGPALLIQQSPAEAGVVSPEAGVHHFELNTNVTLKAVARPGYQFVYWMGDVSQPSAPSTVVRLDSPKIVVAVYERSEYDLPIPHGRSLSAPVGGSGPAAADYSRGGFGAPGGRRAAEFRLVTRPESPQEPTADDFPVPEADDFPVPVPEPATVMLLLMGGMFVHTGVRSRNSLTRKVTR
jgi:hypothetical protein